MPYADPAKKKAYQQAYNRKWYAEHKESRQLVNRAVTNKRELRSKKKQWVTNQLEVLSQDTGMRKYWGTTLNTDATENQKSVMDYTWPELKGYIAQLRATAQGTV